MDTLRWMWGGVAASVTEHSGIDWVAAVFLLLSIWALGSGRREGFLLGIAANVAWIVFGLSVNSAANIVANGVLLLLNVRGYRRWTLREREQRAAASTSGPSAGARDDRNS